MTSQSARPKTISTSADTVGSWLLLDGTPSYAMLGELTCDDEGRIACHLCGRWFKHLGSHLRSHGWSSDRYRQAVGLPLHAALCTAGQSESLAARATANWNQDPAVRASFEAGQRLARDGKLAQRAAQAFRERDKLGTLSQPVRDARIKRLAAGRETRRARRDESLAALVRESGAHDLSSLLRDLYLNGGTLDSLSRLTRLSRQRLSSELEAAGVHVRPAGQNLVATQRNRATLLDVTVAGHVGTTDIRQWLAAQRALGRTLADLAKETDRSIPWVRSRLRGTTTTSRASRLQTSTRDASASAA